VDRVNGEATNGGSLDSKGRFERMEEALLRIEVKLDRKVDMREFDRLEERLNIIETGATPYAKSLIAQFERAMGDIEHLKLLGSANAQEAVKGVHDIDSRVSTLEAATMTQTAVAAMNSRTISNRRWLIGMTVTVSLGTIGILLDIAARFLGHSG
jgi:hypothetical protein